MEHNTNNNDEGSEAKTPTYRIRDVHVSDSDDMLQLSMDLPGVKEQDISVTEHDYELKIEAVRMLNGKEVAKFQRVFLLDKNSIDIPNMEASLLDGVLTLTLPKVEPVEIKVEPRSMEAPAESDATRQFQFDLPGVKAKDLTITVKGEQVSMQGERKVGKNASQINRTFTADVDKIDISKLEAYLLDGILTMVVPVKQQEQTADASSRIFKVERGTYGKESNSLESDQNQPVAKHKQ